MGEQRRYEGGCHCGAVRFAIEVALDDEQLLVCNCSICELKGFVHLMVAPERFELLAGADELTTYRFGTRRAVHRFCRRCGTHPFYTPRSHPGMVDVNARCVDGVEVEALEVTRFDGRNWEASAHEAGFEGT